MAFDEQSDPLGEAYEQYNKLKAEKAKSDAHYEAEIAKWKARIQNQDKINQKLAQYCVELEAELDGLRASK